MSGAGEKPTEIVVDVEDGGAAEEARASAAAAAQAASQAIADAAHVAAQAETGAAERVEEIAEDTLEELNESERRLSTWLEENRSTNLALHQETRQEIQTLKTETAAAIASVVQILERLTPPKSEEPKTPEISPGEQTRTEAQQGKEGAKPEAPATAPKPKRRRI